MNYYNPEIHHRRSIRLKNYDYSQPGAYFVTICSQNRQCLFGENKNAAIILNDAGRMITNIWHQIPDYYPGNGIGEFVVMPNHIHGIIFVGVGLCAYPEMGQPQRVAPTRQKQEIAARLSLPDIVHRFKTITTKQYTDGVKQMGWQPFYGKLWQRNYYERIIRNEDELNEIRQYILSNPIKWALDEENPDAGKG